MSKDGPTILLGLTLNLRRRHDFDRTDVFGPMPDKYESIVSIRIKVIIRTKDTKGMPREASKSKGDEGGGMVWLRRFELKGRE